MAADDATFKPYVSYTKSYEDNLLRFSSKDEALRSVGTDQMSDTMTTEQVGLAINKPIGRQNIVADLNLYRVSLDRFRQFDYNGKSLTGNWNWYLGETLSGNIGTSYKESLTSFSDIADSQLQSAQSNIRIEKDNYAQIAWQIHPSWRLRGDYNGYKLKYDDPAQQGYNFTLKTYNAGIDYVVHSGSSIGLQYGHSRGEYPQQYLLDPSVSINNNYSENNIKLNIDWKYSGKTEITFLGGWAERKRDFDTERNFSGFNARLTAKWAATQQSLVTLSVWREIGALSDLSASYALNSGVSLAGDWSATSKIRLSGILSDEKRNYNGSANIRGITPSNRRDQYKRALLGVVYNPIRHVSITASIFREFSSSNIATSSYQDDGASLNLRYDF